MGSGLDREPRDVPKGAEQARHPRGIWYHEQHDGHLRTLVPCNHQFRTLGRSHLVRARVKEGVLTIIFV